MNGVTALLFVPSVAPKERSGCRMALEGVKEL